MTDPLTLMAVHAHPDDESSSTGGVLRPHAEDGVRTVVVTCTNGELGDGPGHVKPDEHGHDELHVAKVRLAELKVACELLSVSALELLGYHDSGMAGLAARHRYDVFGNVPVDQAAGPSRPRSSSSIAPTWWSPTTTRRYNHPDHLQAHRITVAAVERTGIPSKLYSIARRRRDFQRLRETMRARWVEPPERPAPDQARMAQLEQQMELVGTTHHDIR